MNLSRSKTAKHPRTSCNNGCLNIRQRYNTKVLADLLNTRQKTIRSFLQGQLTGAQAQDLKEKMLKVGIPL